MEYMEILLFCIKFQVTFGAKNVLFIVIDDLRPSLGGYGDPNSHTPNIDSLIEDGFTFESAFAQQALCAPSRNSFLVGRRPDTLHLYDFYSYWRDFSGNFTTLPQYFKDNYYETKSVGKVFHPGQSSNFTDDYPLSWSSPPWHPPSEKFKDAPVCLSSEGWFANIVCPVRLTEQPSKTLPDIETTEEAISFLKLRNTTSKPFFLAVGYHKPHIPLKFPMEFLDYHPLDNITLPEFHHYPPGLPEVAWNPWTDLRRRHDISQLNLTFPFQEIPDDWVKLIRQSYYASVTYVDSLIGKILNLLKVASLDRNTIVILLGDHGWSLGEHGEWSKYSNFDVALRVPLIFRIPNLTHSPKKIKEIVELVDVFPTIVDLCGLPEIPTCPKNSENVQLCTEGQSLLPLMLNEVSNKFGKEGLKWKDRALSQYPRPGLHPSRRPNSDKPKLHEIKIMGYSVRTARYRYTEWIQWNSSTLQGNWSSVYNNELYDHFIDDHENLNIANRPGLESVQEALRKLLRKSFANDSLDCLNHETFLPCAFEVLFKQCPSRSFMIETKMGCASDVVDGISYGTVTGFLIGAVIGAIHAKVVKAPYMKPYVMNGGINNAVFGATFFGLLTAYRSCMN